MTPGDSHATPPSGIEAPPQLPSRERLTVWAGILSVTAISWFVLARMPMPTGSISGMTMSDYDFGHRCRSHGLVASRN
jgi:hypothetical protein